MAMAREFSYFYAPHHQCLQALPGGLLRPHAHRGGLGQPHLRLPPLRRGLRLPVENRIPGADANPYLAFAATIAAGLHGIDKKLKPPKLYDGNAYEDPKLVQVPKTLRRGPRRARALQGRPRGPGRDGGEALSPPRRLEQQAFDQAVTDWELTRLFERI